MLTDVGGGYASEGREGAQPLFRPEALAAAADTGMGRPIGLLPLSWTLLTIFLSVMLVASGLLLLFGTYTRKETASGVVRSEGGDVRVGVPAAGIALSVRVKDGQQVQMGDTLLTVATLRNAMNGQPVDQLALESMDRELANLDERLRALDQAARIEDLGLPDRLATLDAERATASAQELSSRERLALATDTLTKLGPVAERGFISEETMRRRREEVIVLRQAVVDAQGVQSRIEGQIRQLRNLAAQRPMALVQSRGELLDQIARTRRERDVAAKQRGFAVTAPTSGIITAVQVAVGQAVDPQRSLMTISGKDTRMLADIFVPSRAIGFLEPGQAVRVRYDAFPYQRFGVAEGTVQSISSTVLRPQEVEAAVRVEEPVYRVVIALNRSSITAYGRRYRIRPGIALSADIVLERSTFATWLLGPLVALRGRF